MPLTTIEYFSPEERKRWVLRIVILIIIIAGVLVWLWWVKVYESPTNVFWGMVKNNLNVSSVSENVTEYNSGSTLNKTLQLELGGTNVAHSITTYTQSAGIVKTEELSTPDAYYVRYSGISSTQKGKNGKPLNFSSLINKWGISSQPTKNLANLNYPFDLAIMNIFPIANMTPDQTNALVKYIKNSGVYKFTPSAVKKELLNRRKVYVYSVQLAEAPYILLAEKFYTELGLPTEKLDINDYTNLSPANFQVTVDASSHELTELVDATGQNKMIYSGYNVQGYQLQIPKLPSSTIPFAQLEQNLKNIAAS